jgi:hypothetical protein
VKRLSYLLLVGAISLGAVIAVPVRADAVERYQPACKGERPEHQLLRCVELHYDPRPGYNRLRAHAWIDDKPLGGDFQVSVDWVSINGSRRTDLDGWYGFWADHDDAVSNFAYCPGNTGWQTFTVEAGFSYVFPDGTIGHDRILDHVVTCDPGIP